MEFDQKLDNYAELLVRFGLNVQPGQEVYIQGEIIHRDLIYRCARSAWRCGAKHVGVTFIDPYLARLRVVEHRSPEQLEYVPEHVVQKFSHMVDSHAALLRIIGSEDPDLLADLDVKDVNNMELSYRRAINRFYTEGIGKSQTHWTLASAATPAWARKIFPNMTEEKACQALWEQIFSICRVDRSDFLGLWRQHNHELHARAKQLTELKIKELHFEGPGTDLHIGLSPKALFTGGTSTGPHGVDYEANIPTEECFTTPDWRTVNGYVSATRPVMMHGVLIECLKLTFKDGVVVEHHADKGMATFTQFLSADEGARRIGEVALVSIDSPVYQSGLLFQQTLYDENAACHFALGNAYRFCLDGGAAMSDQEIDEIGCNCSSVHADLMISSEEVDVTATTYSGDRIVIIHEGRWV